MVPGMAADAPTFGDLLRQHRRAHNLTQEALAERASVSARAISDLERGLRTHPYRETAQLLANALHLSGNERAAFWRRHRVHPVRCQQRRRVRPPRGCRSP